VITDYSITLGEPQTTFEIKRLDSNSFSVTVSSPTGPAGAATKTALSLLDAQVLADTFTFVSSSYNV
jgi:hypothetical protein